MLILPTYKALQAQLVNLGLNKLFPARSDLYFDNKGWLHSRSDLMTIKHVPVVSHTKGLHAYIKKNYGHMMGTVTHYDAISDAKVTVRRMANNGNKARASTHFVIARDGMIYQLVSILDRSWHAGLAESDPEFFIPPMGRSTHNPNSWFIGIDFSNLGYLDATFKAHNGFQIKPQHVFIDSSARSEKYKYWEAYREEAVHSYIDLVIALNSHLKLLPDMHFTHAEIAPHKKIDPGPALPFAEIHKAIANNLHYADGDFRMGDIKSV